MAVCPSSKSCNSSNTNLYMQDLSCVMCKNVAQTIHMLAQHALPSLVTGTLGQLWSTTKALLHYGDSAFD